MLRIVKNGETVSPSTTFSNGNASVVFGVSATAKGAKVAIPEHIGETTFDFTGVSNEQIKQLAVDTLVIKLQGKCRNTYRAKKDGGAVNMVKVVPNAIKVLDFITTRARVDKVEKGKSLIAGMTPEQRKEMAKILAAHPTAKELVNADANPSKGGKK